MEGWSWPGHREWKVAAAGALEKTRLAGWHDGPAPLSAPGEGDAGPALRPHCVLKRDRAPPCPRAFPLHSLLVWFASPTAPVHQSGPIHETVAPSPAARLPVSINPRSDASINSTTQHNGTRPATGAQLAIA